MKILLLVLSVLAVVAEAHSGPYKTSSCKDSNFGGTAWRDISVAEPRVQKHLDFIAEESGDINGTVVNLTNCRIQTPVNTEGAAVNGDRIVTMDKVWETRENGVWVKRIAGMRIVYSERLRTRIPQKEWVLTPEGYYVEHIVYIETIGRRIQGFSICAGNACNSLEIPYAGAVGMGEHKSNEATRPDANAYELPVSGAVKIIRE